MNELLRAEGIDKRALSPLIIGTKEAGLNTQYSQENPVLTKPIFFDGHEYIIISPTNLAYAFLEHIWQMAKNWGCTKALAELYHELTWQSLQNNLVQMHFQRFEHKFIIEPIHSAKVKWELYTFDDNKIALIEYFFDDALDYTTSDLAYFNSDAAHALKKQIINGIRSNPDYKTFELFDLSLTSSVGRAFLVPITKIPGTTVLNIPVSEFDILSQLKQCTAIDLWKFAIARTTKMPETPGINFSFLDYYQLYQNHNSSFFLSDHDQFTHIFLEEGYGSTGMLQKAKQHGDIHAVLRCQKDGRKVYVTVERMDQYSTVYVNKEDLMHGELYFLVEGLPQPVWITPKMGSYNKDLRSTIYHFTDALAYWLWQISTHIAERLKPLGHKPLTMFFELQNEDEFVTLTKTPTDLETLSKEFSLRSAENDFTISIPDSIISFLSRPDNLGERELLRQIMLGFNLLLAGRSMQIFTDVEIAEMVEAVAPIGLKKKFFIVDAGNNTLLDKRNLQPHRYIQEHDTSNVLDMIVPLLGEKCPPIGDIPDREQKRKLAYNIVAVLASYLTSQVNRYNCEELIRRLIGLYESLTQKREDIILTTPTRQECYSVTDNFLKELQEQRSRLSATTIAIRCLLEHVAAEQVLGSEKLSIAAIDELIAIINQIMTWGTAGDQLNYELFDLKISILPTGRIGTEKKEFNEVFDPYIISKTKEDIEDFKKTFKIHFDVEEGIDSSPFPENIDNAFLVDYGISFLRICAFLDVIAAIGSRQGHDYCQHDAETFFDAVNHVAETAFSKEEFDAAIDYLTLRYREKVTNKPEGCDNFDISPWRFNRRLSFLRRPMILMEKTISGQPIFYWGFRSALMTKRYVYDTLRSGRLRVSDDSRVSKVMGKLANERGDSLVDKVSTIIKKSGFTMDTEVTIAPKGKFKNIDDIGDVDCLVIDDVSKTLFSLECKAMAPSRNMKEMVEELTKLMGSESERGWIDKHLRRDEWLKNNIAVVGARYGINLGGYAIKSVFVTREQMLAPHLLNDLHMPFVTLYDLEKSGIDCLHVL